MFTPDDRTVYWMSENKLNEIATSFYGREYNGQQTGDMLPNDSYHLFVMDEVNVAELTHTMKKNRHYLGLKRVAKGTGDWGGDHVSVCHEGHNWLDYWLSLSHDPDSPDNLDNPRDGEDHFGGSFKFDFQVYRQAPTIDYILADLITKGELPYGDYMITVSW